MTTLAGVVTLFWPFVVSKGGLIATAMLYGYALPCHTSLAIETKMALQHRFRNVYLSVLCSSNCLRPDGNRRLAYRNLDDHCGLWWPCRTSHLRRNQQGNGRLRRCGSLCRYVYMAQPYQRLFSDKRDSRLLCVSCCGYYVLCALSPTRRMERQVLERNYDLRSQIT